MKTVLPQNRTLYWRKIVPVRWIIQSVLTNGSFDYVFALENHCSDVNNLNRCNCRRIAVAKTLATRTICQKKTKSLPVPQENDGLHFRMVDSTDKKHRWGKRCNYTIVTVSDVHPDDRGIALIIKRYRSELAAHHQPFFFTYFYFFTLLLMLLLDTTNCTLMDCGTLIVDYTLPYA